ncbi:hypothetical protein QF036_003411 [Arthrobacter globiformis]|nr:hypothetical protein [Arthrobacter globiformis]
MCRSRNSSPLRLLLLAQDDAKFPWLMAEGS